MKVLSLQCAHQHGFEGWFGSEDDYQSQLARALVECPVCGDTGITKLPSAPRLNLGASAPAAQREVAPSGAPALAAGAPVLSGDADLHKAQAALWKMARHILANTEDVGTRFAEESRKMHYGEATERNIRGQASREETEALLEEGIPVMPLPLPAALKETLQ